MLTHIIIAYLIKKMAGMNYLEKKGIMEIMAQVIHTLVSLDMNYFEKIKLLKYGVINQQQVSVERLILVILIILMVQQVIKI